MGNGFQFLDIVFFALVAGFLILRLRSVLGRRTGNERPPEVFPLRPPMEPPARPIKLPEPPRTGRQPEETSVDRRVETQVDRVDTSPLAANLTKIRIADRDFDPDRFLAGARAAFDIVVAAFAKGDAGALRPLLSGEVFAQFKTAIDARNAAGHTLETTVVAGTAPVIVDADIDGRTARITVKFATQQINVTRDGAGNIVDGDANAPADVTDIWTFARNLRSPDPNWTLIATEARN